MGFISGGCCRDFDIKEWFMNATYDWMSINDERELKA